MTLEQFEVALVVLSLLPLGFALSVLGSKVRIRIPELRRTKAGDNGRPKKRIRSQSVQTRTRPPQA